MTLSAYAMAVGALLIVVAGWLYYLWLIPKERVPERPFGFVATMAVGIGISGASLLDALRGEEGISPALVVCTGLTLGLAAFFVYLLKQAPLPDGDIRVSVGETMLPFAADDADGGRFHSDEIGGKRILLKFFRGHW